MKFTFVILTFNEELHIKRVLENIAPIAENIIIIDSYSNDRTLEICRDFGAIIFQRKFDYQAKQFNVFLKHFPKNTNWVIRLDADEYFCDQSIARLKSMNYSDLRGFNGVSFLREYIFLGKQIKYGGIYPTRIVRAFRFGCGEYEDRIMDEHLVIDGAILNTKDIKIYDHNLNKLDWYIKKHLNYAVREAQISSSADSRNLSFTTRIKRQIKSKFFLGRFSFIIIILYFFYRYIIRGGFRDGFIGFIFHFIQGFVYRVLVSIQNRLHND